MTIDNQWRKTRRANGNVTVLSAMLVDFAAGR